MATITTTQSLEILFKEWSEPDLYTEETPPIETEPFPIYIEPMDIGYYYGLPGNPKLLARNYTVERLPNTFLDEVGTYQIQGKRAYEIGGELAEKIKREKLEQELFQICHGLIGRSCLLVEIMRIGFEDEPKMNPVVVLVTLEKGVDPTDAEWVIAEIKNRIDSRGILGIEIEVKEGDSTTLPLDTLRLRLPPVLPEAISKGPPPFKSVERQVERMVKQLERVGRSRILELLGNVDEGIREG